MHMDTMVIVITFLKSEVKFDIWGLGCVKATMASEATKKADMKGNICTWILG